MNDKQPLSVHMLFTSDIHGHWSTEDGNSTGNMSKAAHYVARKRREQKHVCFGDNGDLLQGSPLSYYLSTQGTNGAQMTASLLHETQFDFAIPGNHDFDYGIDYLQSVMNQCKFPWLAANVKDTTGDSIAKDYVIFSFDHIRIALIGVTTRIPMWQYPDRNRNVYFEDEVEAVKSVVQELQSAEQQPDAIVVCYHGGFEDEDAHLHKLRENQARRMATEVHGIDCIITGHQHQSWIKQIDETVIIQPGVHGQSLGEINFTFTDASTSKPSIECEIIDLSNEEEHPEIIRALEPIRQQANTFLDAPLAPMEQDVIVHDWKDIVSREHLLIEWMHQVQLEDTGAQLSAVAYVDGSYHSFRAPQVTTRDLITMFPYPDQLKVFTINGQMLREALEVTASWYRNDALEPTDRWLHPHLQLYKWIMFDGIDYKIDIHKNIGERIVELRYKNRQVDDYDQFRIVMTGFLAEQTELYPMFANLTDEIVITGHYINHLENNIKTRDLSQITYRSNWSLVGGTKNEY